MKNRRRPGRRLGLLAGLVVLLLVASGRAAVGDHQPGWQLLADDVLWDRVDFRIVQEPDPLRYHVLRVHPGAPVRFKPVVSNGRLAFGRETVSSMCSRVGAIGCVNANFAICPTCNTPHGAVVRKHQLLQSPTDHQYQLSIVDGRFQTGEIPWSARIEAVRSGAPDVLHIDGINSPLPRDGIVLRNRHHGATTGSPEGTVELVLRAPTPLWVGGVRQQVEPVRLVTDGNARIPAGGAVLSGRGMGAHVLWAWAWNNARVPMDLVVHSPRGMELAVSGHPTLLVAGERTALDPADPKVYQLHPRTLVGWDDLGSVWFVVVDGRQPHSRGITLHEAQDLLLKLGATHGMNMDGGGSSAITTSCEIGWCLRNRPSDGRERRVGVALAVVPPERW